MVCTEVPNQIKFVSRPHPTGSRTDIIYTDFDSLQPFPQLTALFFLLVLSSTIYPCSPENRIYQYTSTGTTYIHTRVLYEGDILARFSVCLPPVNHAGSLQKTHHLLTIR
jgi:hypothetical protein